MANPATTTTQTTPTAEIPTTLPSPGVVDPQTALLESLDGRIDSLERGGKISARSAEIIRSKLSKQDSLHLTAEEGKELLDIIEKSPSSPLDQRYIEQALGWGGLALLRQCPDRASFTAYAERKYGEVSSQDMSFQYFEQALSVPRGDGTISQDFVNKFANGEQDAAMIIKWSQYAANKYGVEINPNIIAAIYGKETTFGTNVRQSTAGAQGHMQIMPDTMGWLEGLHPELRGLSGAEKQFAAGSLYYGYLKEMFNSDRAAIMSYNMGQGNYQEYQRTGALYAETRDYIKTISSWLGKLGMQV